MTTSSPQLPHGDLQRQRDQIARGLRRLNTAAIIVLLVVLALAIAAALESRSSERQRARAETAESDAHRKLYDSRLAQARAERLTDAMGRRSRALESIGAAIALRRDLPDIDPLPLRNEAIASLTLDDAEVAEAVLPFPSNLTAYAVSRFLEQYAFGFSDGRVSIVRALDGQALQTLESGSSTSGVHRIAYSPDGKSVAVSHQNGRVFLHESNRVARVGTSSTAAGIQFSADGKWIAVLSASGTARIFDCSKTETPVAQFTNVQALAFHPLTNWVALNLPRRIRFVGFDGRDVMRPITNPPPAEGLAFRPDGRQLAAAHSYFGLTLWDVKSHEALRLSVPLGDFYQMTYDPEGETIAAALGDGASRIWSARTGKLLHKFDDGRISQFISDGERFVFEHPRRGLSIGRLLHSPVLRTLRWDPTLEYFRRFWCVEFSGDGRQVAAVDLLNLVVWDVSSGRTLANTLATPRCLSVAWVPGEKAWLTTSNVRLSLHSLRESETHPILQTDRNIELAQNVNNLGQGVLAPDGRTIGVVTEGHTAWLIDVTQPDHRVKLESHGAGSLGHLTFSPDSKWIASSATKESAILLWDAATGKLSRQIPGEHGRVLFGPDGKSLVLGTAREYSFWDTSTWHSDVTRSIARDNLAETTGALTFAPDGKLAIARTRQLVQIVDSMTSRELGSLTAPQPQTVSWLRFNPQGDKLAVAGFDGAVQLWNIRWLEEQLTAMGLSWAETAARRSTPASLRHSRLLLLPVIAVVLVLTFIVFAFRRQRQLFAAYVELDELALKRARELEAAQTEVVHAQKMRALGTLAAGIAHDFNNLLSVIRLSNQLTGEEAPGHMSIQENVGEIEQAVTQGKKIVRSMLGYSREQGDEAESVALPDIVEDTVALLSKQFLAGIALRLELDRDLPSVRVSRSRIEQILLNLVVNASEAMKGQGTLRIVVRRRASVGSVTVLRPPAAKSYAELVIADTGPGIDAAILPRIFEPFFTTKNRDATRGTGLGLSTVYTMAEQEGFGISVTSRAGEGTEFRIVVPLDGTIATS